MLLRLVSLMCNLSDEPVLCLHLDDARFTSMLSSVWSYHLAHVTLLDPNVKPT